MASLDARIEHGGLEDLLNSKVIGDRTRGEVTEKWLLIISRF